MSVLNTQNLVFTYDEPYDDGQAHRDASALKGVSVAIEKGELVAILGHNGSGKSTLLKHFNAILTPTSGTVSVEGMDTSDDKNLIAIRRKAGMVFQNPDNQLVASLVEDDVAFAPENLGVAPQEIRERVDRALGIVGMSNYKRHEVHRLSGGQKQRVAIAGVLAMHPDILLFDEPTAMLDPSGRKEVMDTLLRLNREEKLTVLLITHDMEEAARCDRVIVMNKGELLLDGTPRDVFSQVELLHSVGLEAPQVTQMAHELRKQGIDFPAGVLTPEEFAAAFDTLAKGGSV